MMRVARLIVGMLLALGITSSELRAESGDSALGPNGDYYRIHSGLYGQFFSAGLIPASNSVLVLDIYRAGSARPNRILVPGTEADEVEVAPAVAFEEASNSLILIWSSQWNFIHSKINFALFQDGNWSRTIELSGDPWSRKSFPAVAPMSDRYFSVGSDGPVSQLRAIYNVVWWEEASTGERVVYAPVTFVDGSYIGWNPTFALSEIGDHEAHAGTSPPALAGLGRVPTIQVGVEKSSVLMTFVHPISHTLETFQLLAVDGEIALLASLVTGNLQTYLDSNTATSSVSLAEYVRPQIVDFGARLGMHPGVTSYVGQQVQQTIQSLPADQLAPWLSEYGRPQIVDFGVRMSLQGLTGQADQSEAWVMDFVSNQSEPQVATHPPHSIRLRRIASRELPPSPSGAPVTLLVSADGQAAIAAWQVEQEIGFVESRGTGWSEVWRLQLGPHLTSEQALALLGTKLRGR